MPLTLFKRVVCERELETEQNCNILTPTLLSITVFFPVLLGCSAGGLEAQPLLDMFLNPASSLQLIRSPTANFLSSPGLYNNLMPTLLPASVTISHSFNLSTVKVIISWYSPTGCTCYLHRCISYFDSLAGSEVNMQDFVSLNISCLSCFWRFFKFYLLIYLSFLNIF